MNELLKKLGIEYSDLNQEEINLLSKWQQQLSSREIRLDDIKHYINGMIESLEKELHGYNTPDNFTSYLFRRKRNRNLEARLLNYLMLRDFLVAPDRAKQYIEQQLLLLKK